MIGPIKTVAVCASDQNAAFADPDGNEFLLASTAG
jgi:hypothetical protein